MSNKKNSDRTPPSTIRADEARLIFDLAVKAKREEGLAASDALHDLCKVLSLMSKDWSANN